MGGDEGERKGKGRREALVEMRDGGEWCKFFKKYPKIYYKNSVTINFF